MDKEKDRVNNNKLKLPIIISLVILIIILILVISFLYFFNTADFNEISDLVFYMNRDSEVKNVKEIGDFEEKYKWVGGIMGEDGCIYGIPNGSDKVIKIDPKTEQIEFFGELSNKGFKYTGGCFYKDKIYGFPRKSNNLLEIDTKNKSVKEINLNMHYNDQNDFIDDHHYSGTLCGNVVYLAPRIAHYILAINLDTYNTCKIGENIIPKDYRYCGGILHSNGLIYFFPEKNAQVMVLDPETQVIKFIGEKSEVSAFSGAIAKNGNIYSFTSYSDGGILKINPETEQVEVICKDIESGFYGTKLSTNGKMYSVIGLSNKIYEFDPKTEQVRLIKEVDRNTEGAMCAGGTLDKSGNIWFIPAYGTKIYKLEIDQKIPFNNHILESVQFSNY